MNGKHTLVISEIWVRIIGMSAFVGDKKDDNTRYDKAINHKKITETCGRCTDDWRVINVGIVAKLSDWASA